ncbi:MAG: AbrB/MazE/SpoVT family DNA-binding domain-containing protein [Armatimonadetes bacterium]|nr:AbrB/MazE/SpoVT family DNA-binding domain-containing protein [Armatimonadota bacterium]
MKECDMGFYGTATVGERGQIVIPAEARSDMKIVAGDKLLVVKHPTGAGLMIFKFEAAREFFEEMLGHMKGLEAQEETKG